MPRFVFLALAVSLPLIAACSQQPPAAVPAPAPPAAAGAPSTQGNAAETTPPETPHDAKTVLRQLSDFYKQRKAFQVDYSQKVAMEFNGMKTDLELEAKIDVERPNRFALRNKNSQLGADVVCDGEQLAISMTPLKQYTQSSAPATLDELLANPLLAAGSGGRGPLLEVFSEHPYEKLMEGVTKDEYIGLEKIGELDAHHLKFSKEQFDWEIWVAAKDQPRLLQASFDLAKAMAGQGFDDQQIKNMKMTSVQAYKNWQFDAPPGKDDFAFEPPTGAKKVDNFFAGGAAMEQERSPLVGQPAADVEQELVDGSHFSLKEQQNKKVVILDFWATWCGPCVQEMPLVAKVAEEYHDKGVALFCVNQREDADTIRDFLGEKKLNVTVSLDSQGEAGNAFGVQGIPTLVLINKSGVVQSVHIGYSPDIVEKLKEELDAILAGKDLAAEGEPAPKADAAKVPEKSL